MSSPIPTMTIDKLQLALGKALYDKRVKHDPQKLLICLSIAEHLKDAIRWQYVAGNTLRWNHFEPRTAADFRKWIDQEIENERPDLSDAHR